jgi:hypothetical protein
MDSAVAQQLQALVDLDAQHDDLLRQLDELDRRVAQVLAEYSPPPTPQIVAAPVPLQREAA